MLKGIAKNSEKTNLKKVEVAVPQNIHDQVIAQALVTDTVFSDEAPALLSERDIAQQVHSYRDWLHLSMLNRNAREGYIQLSKYAYIQQALKATEIGGKVVKSFAPFAEGFSAFHTLSRKQLFVCLVVLLSFIVGIVLAYQGTLIITTSVITLLYVGDLLLNFIVVCQSISKVNEEDVDERVLRRLATAEWPRYTILCPLYKEAAIVHQFITAMSRLDYPKERLQILLLTEEDDHETQNILTSMDLPAHFSLLTVPAGKPRTKPRACNYGLLHATGDYIVIYDAEDIVDPRQLKKAVLAFANQGPEVVCVQAKLNFYNVQQNWLTRCFTAEYQTWFDLIMPGLRRFGFPLPLGGTSNHFPTEALRALGGWDAFNVTEDCDLGMRLALHGKKAVIVNSTTFEEANSQLKNWLRQRSRWIKGYIQTYLVHMRHTLPMLRRGQLREFIALQFLIGGKTIAFFLNPLLWVLTISFFLFRAQVEPFYHQIFPTPVLYMGMCCLFLGNFFFIYTHLLGCCRRQRYYLVKWCFLLPLYWFLMSVASLKALYQLAVKPHYWEKTLHGLHLGSQGARMQLQVLDGEEEAERQTSSELLAEAVLNGKSLVAAGRAGSLSPGETISHEMSDHLPAFSPVERRLFKRPTKGVKDRWFLAAVATACISSILAYLFFYAKHETLLYGDAYAHLRIARSVFDSATPGITQLGSVWLPLPHILMLPFVWNDFLWRTGLAGSIPAMLAYVVAGTYLYLIVRQLTGKREIGFLTTLIFLWNPSVLYLQTTALGEIPCTAAFLAAAYYFLLWMRKAQMKYLVLAALATCLATLIRYDGWALFCVFCVGIVVIGIWKRRPWQHIEGQLLIFIALGGFGILLWLIWNQMIFGNMLYFQNSEYSAQAQQQGLILIHRLYAYHNLWQAVRYYALDVLETFGYWFVIFACIALAVYLLRVRRLPALIVAAIICTPFVFYVTTQFFGQSTIYLPMAHLPSNPVWYNVRYGVEMVAPFSLALGLGLAYTPFVRLLQHKVGLIVRLIFLGILAFQGLQGHNPSLTDGLVNASCDRPSDPVNVYLARHYNGGKILVNQFTSQINPQDYGGYGRDLISEANGALWRRVLVHPEQQVDWVIVNPDNLTDKIAQKTNVRDLAFNAYFRLVVQQNDGLRLYLRRGIAEASLPMHPPPQQLVDLQTLCQIESSNAKT